jgi:NitT/TauT family transport system permease protein/taurine transport system permease protein
MAWLLKTVLRHPAVKFCMPFAVLLVLWWAIDALDIYPHTFFVGPGAVIERFSELLRKGVLTEHLQESLMRLSIGGFFAILAGIILGYVIGLNSYIRRACWPILMFFQAIADIAWVPLLILWFGFSLTTINFVLFYSIVFPLILSIIAGIDSLRIDLLRAARSLGASRRQIFFHVVLPGSFAYVATGIRVGLGYGWRALIASEIIVGTSGLGFMLFEARRDGDIATVLAGMTVLAVLWYATDALILAPLERETVERWGLVRGTETK